MPAGLRVIYTPYGTTDRQPGTVTGVTPGGRIRVQMDDGPRQVITKAGRLEVERAL